MTNDVGRSPHTDSLAPKILALNAEGMRSIDIAARLNCSRANVCQTLRLYKRASVSKGGRQPKVLPRPSPQTDECPDCGREACDTNH